MPRPLAFKVLTPGTYLPINRTDISFVTVDGILMYLGHGCFLAKDKSNHIYLAFGSPEEAAMVPEGTVVGVHFSDEPEDEVEFLLEDLDEMLERGPSSRDRESLEALERMLDGENGSE